MASSLGIPTMLSREAFTIIEHLAVAAPVHSKDDRERCQACSQADEAISHLRAFLGTALTTDEAVGFGRISGLLHATLGEHTDWKHRAAQLHDALRATAGRAEAAMATNNLVAKLCVAAGAQQGAQIVPWLCEKLGMDEKTLSAVEPGA